MYNYLKVAIKTIEMTDFTMPTENSQQCSID